MSYSEVLLLNFLGKGEEPRRTPVDIVGVPAEIRKGHVPKRGQTLYCLSQLAL